MSKRCLPPKLKNAKHWDYPKGLKWIPRSWTSYCFGRKAPRLIAGNQKSQRVSEDFKKGFQRGPAPIGEAGSFQISWPPYLAFTTKGGRHFHIGARWDDVDGYYSFPSIMVKRFSD